MATRGFLHELRYALRNTALRRFDNGTDLRFETVSDTRIRLSIFECVVVEFELVHGRYVIVEVIGVMYFANNAERIRCRQELGLNGSTSMVLIKDLAFACLYHFGHTVFIVLEDDSKLRFLVEEAVGPEGSDEDEEPDDDDVIEISFSTLKLLADGISWYNRQGFITARPENEYPVPDSNMEEYEKRNLHVLRSLPSPLNTDLTVAEQARIFLDGLRTLVDTTPLQQDQMQFVLGVKHWVESIEEHPLFRYSGRLSMQLTLAPRINL